MSRLTWTQEIPEQNCWISEISWTMPENIGGTFVYIGSTFVFRIQPRPHYCDRGDWTLFVDERPTKGPSGFIRGFVRQCDGSDGFPRMFFGSLDEAKEQFERFCSKRKCLQGQT